MPSRRRPRWRSDASSGPARGRAADASSGRAPGSPSVSDSAWSTPAPHFRGSRGAYRADTSSRPMPATSPRVAQHPGGAQVGTTYRRTLSTNWNLEGCRSFPQSLLTRLVCGWDRRSSRGRGVSMAQLSRLLKCAMAASSPGPERAARCSATASRCASSTLPPYLNFALTVLISILMARMARS